MKQLSESTKQHLAGNLHLNPFSKKLGDNGEIIYEYTTSITLNVAEFFNTRAKAEIMLPKKMVHYINSLLELDNEGLKTKRNRLIDEAANAALEYAQSCEVGRERTRALKIRDCIMYSPLECN